MRYVGNCSVTAPTGIDVIKDAISKLLTIHLESDWTVGYALISATTTRDTKIRILSLSQSFLSGILFHIIPKFWDFALDFFGLSMSHPDL